MTIAIVIIIILVAIWEGPATNEERYVEPVYIDSLDPFTVTTFQNLSYLDEGSTELYDVLGEYLPSVDNGEVLFIHHINVSIEFRDEDNQPPYTNQRDVFRLSIFDEGGMSNNSAEAGSFQENGSCFVHWKPGNAWIGVGISDLVYLVDGEVLWSDSIPSVIASVKMLEAGHQTNPPTMLLIVDCGNEYRISISFEGRVYKS